VRHGQTEWNVAERMQGRMDSSLTDQGRRHAQANGKLLQALGSIDRLWASPSGRTTETAMIINSFTQVDIQFADELLERDCGVWSGLTIAQIEEQFGDDWQARKREPFHFRPPDGENYPDMLQRVQTFLDDLFAFEVNAVALITHGVMSKVILAHLLGLSEVEAPRVKHPNDLVYRLTFNAQDIDTHHFIAGGEPQTGLLYATPAPSEHPAARE